MKTKLIYIISFVLFSMMAVQLSAQYIAIPDANFEQALIDQKIDSEGIQDGKILTQDALQTESLLLDGTNLSAPRKIQDLTGITAFTNLKVLHVQNHQLQELDLSKNTQLREVDCSSNQLKVVLDLSNLPNLTKLEARNNPDLQFIRTLDVENATQKKGQFSQWEKDLDVTYSDQSTGLLPIPLIISTLTDSLVHDPNMDDIGNPGDSIEYTLEIENTGSDTLTNLDITRTMDPNTTLDPNSIRATPLAFDDAYAPTVFPLMEVAPGLLTNDADINDIEPNPPYNNNLMVAMVQVGATGVQHTTNQGGKVTVAADGSFTYDTMGISAGALTDTFTYKITDTEGFIDSAIAVIFLNMAPVLANIEVNKTTFTENGGSVQLTNTLTVTDDEANLESAIIEICTNYAVGEDTLEVIGALPGGITASWNETTGTLMLMGSATVADYQTALRQIHFNNSSQDPNTSDRTVCFTVNDGDLNSNTEMRDVMVMAVDDCPASWFVDDDGSTTGTGTFLDPFDDLGDAQTASSAGDYIFLFTGTYSTGITLKDNQKLIGEGEAWICPSDNSVIQVAGTAPLVDASIVLASNDTIKGLTFGSVNDFALKDNGSVGNLLVNNATINNTLGGAMQLNNGGTPSVTLDNITSTGGTHAIQVDLDALSNITVNGSTTINNASIIAIDINNTPNSTLDFGITQIGQTTFCVNGVNINTCTGTTTTFDALNVTTSGGTGVLANNAGTLNTSSGTIQSGANTAVDISNTVIGMTLTSVSSGAGSNIGIILSTIASGNFTITGSASTPGSGGIIQDKSDVDGIQFSNTSCSISLSNMDIEDIAHTLDGSDAIGTRRNIDGIHGEMVLGGLSLINCRLKRFSDCAINGRQIADGISSTSWVGLTITNCTIENANRYHVSGLGDSGDEGGVYIRGLSGDLNVTGSTFVSTCAHLDIGTATTGTFNATLQSNTFNTTIKEFMCSGGIVNIGKRGVSLMLEGSIGGNIYVGDPMETMASLGNSFTDNASASLVIIGQSSPTHTGNVKVVVSRNNFIVNDHLTGPSTCPAATFTFNFPQGGVALNPAGGNFEAIVSHNLFDEVMNAAGGLGQLTLGINGGDFEGIVRNNTFMLPWNGSVQLRADGNNSAAVLFENNTYVDGEVGTANDDLGQQFQSPFLGYRVNVRNGGDLDLTMRNDILPQQDDMNPGGDTYSFIAEVQNQAGNNLDLYLNNVKSPDGYDLMQSVGSFNLYRSDMTDVTPVDILDGNGCTGGNGMSGVPNPAVNGDNTTPPVVNTAGTITTSDTPPTLPNITIP